MSSSVTEVATETATASVGLGTIFVDLIFAVVIAWGGYYFVTLILRKIFAEHEKLNGKDGETQTTSSITVDGETQEVEITIDGETSVQETQNEVVLEEKPKISGGTIAMFSISGLYLVIEWIVNTVSRFM